MTSNLQDIKENGIYITNLEGIGYLYQLNSRMFVIGKKGFYEM